MNRRAFLFGVGVVLVLFVLLLVRVRAADPQEDLKLYPGKNVVFFESSPFYVVDLIKLNPSIEVVSYTQGGTTTGYVNVLGGVGKNFIVQPGTYEVIVPEETTLILPQYV